MTMTGQRPISRWRGRCCRPRPPPSWRSSTGSTSASSAPSRMLLECRGRVIVTGMGKSGIICRKIAATLVEHRHAGLLPAPGRSDPRRPRRAAGRRRGAGAVLQRRDRRAAAAARDHQAARRAADRHDRRRRSTLAQAADVALDCRVSEEACPLNLVPTASTTAALALGDALAMTLLVAKGFRQEDFANLHPGGKLGKRLMRVEQLMHGGDAGADRVGHRRAMPDVIYEMSRKGLGMACVVDDDGALAGIITDGDLRRHMVSADRDLLERTAGDVMTTQPGHGGARHAGRRGAEHPRARGDHLGRRRGRAQRGARRRAPARPLAHRDVLRSARACHEPHVRLRVPRPCSSPCSSALGVGKAWERYKLRDGRWIDRRRLRETPHYMLGLNFLVDNQVDQAIDELTQADEHRQRRARDPDDPRQPAAARRDRWRAPSTPPVAAAAARPDPDRARLRAALPRPRLPARRLRRPGARGVSGSGAARPAATATRWSTCRSSTKSSTSGPRPPRARARSRDLDGGRARPTTSRSSGSCATRSAGRRRPARSSDAAAALQRGASTPTRHRARLPEPRRRARARRATCPAAIEAWEQLDAHACPTARTWRSSGWSAPTRRPATPARFVELCERLIAAASAGLARAPGAVAPSVGGRPARRGASICCSTPCRHNPHGLAIHQEMWRALLGARPSTPCWCGATWTSRASAVFYLDPHVCTRCRYRSTELLWQCPQCHEWNTFVEERIAPARGLAEVGDASPS